MSTSSQNTDRATAEREWRKARVALTRAENSGSPHAILDACDAAHTTFETYGYPDWWSRIDRMRNDANLKIAFA